MSARRIKKKIPYFVVSTFIIAVIFIYAVIIMSLIRFDDTTVGARIGYTISSIEELKMLQSLDNFDDKQLFIEGENLLKEHNQQLGNIRLYITNLFISIIGFTTLIFTMYYMHTKDKDQKLNNVIKSEVEKADLLVEKQNHDLKLINEYLTHELKNSLSVLQAKVYLQSEDTLDYITKMSSQIDDINALIEPEVNLDNAFMIDDLIYSLEDEINGEIEFHYDEVLMVQGSDLLIERALYNIITNAYKYGATKVWINIKQIKGNVIFEINNDGPMISNEQLDKIFTMHYRINELNVDGSGIGLALVKNIVDIHHGSIYVESNDINTCFYVSFKAFDVEELYVQD